MTTKNKKTSKAKASAKANIKSDPKNFKKSLSKVSKTKLKTRKLKSKFSKIKFEPKKALKLSSHKTKQSLLIRDSLFNLKFFFEGLLALPWLLTTSGFVILSFFFWSNSLVSNSFVGYLEISRFSSKALWLVCLVFILSNYTISFFVRHSLKSLSYLTSGVSLFLVIFISYILFYPI
jgi:hypothetical protein